MGKRQAGKQFALMDYAILSWLVFTFFYLYCKSKGQTAYLPAGFALFGKAALDIILIYFSIINFRNKQLPFKNLDFCLLLSFIAVFFADFSFHFFVNILQYPLDNSIDTLFDVPFLIFLLFQMIFWYRVVFNLHEKTPYSKKEFLSQLPAPLFLLFFFNCVISWKLAYFSMIGIFHILDTLFESIGLCFALLALLKLRHQSMRLLAYGYLLIITADMSIRYQFISNMNISFSAFELLWVLGLICMCIALITISKNRKVNLGMIGNFVNQILVKLIPIKTQATYLLKRQTFGDAPSECIFYLYDEDEGRQKKMGLDEIKANHQIINRMYARDAFNIGREIGALEIISEQESSKKT